MLESSLYYSYLILLLIRNVRERNCFFKIWKGKCGNDEKLITLFCGMRFPLNSNDLRGQQWFVFQALLSHISFLLLIISYIYFCCIDRWSFRIQHKLGLCSMHFIWTESSFGINQFTKLEWQKMVAFWVLIKIIDLHLILNGRQTSFCGLNVKILTPLDLWYIYLSTLFSLVWIIFYQ